MDSNSSTEQPIVKKQSDLGLASMIVGVAALFSIVFIFPTFWFGIIGIVLGVIQIRTKRSSSVAIGGIILNVIAIIICSFILFVMMIIGLIGSSTQSDSGSATGGNGLVNRMSNELENSMDQDEQEEKHNSNIYGSWLINKTLYTFREDGTWEFYEDYTDSSDDYYNGSDMEIVSGQEALDLAGIEEDERKEYNINKYRFFYLTLPVEIHKKKTENLTENLDKEYRINFIIFYPNFYNDNEAILINTVTGEQLTMERFHEDNEEE